jgi:hypothetical protein
MLVGAKCIRRFATMDCEVQAESEEFVCFCNGQSTSQQADYIIMLLHQFSFAQAQNIFGRRMVANAGKGRR